MNTLRARWPVTRESGFQLLELMFAMTIFLVGLLGFLFSFQSNATATRDIVDQDFSASTVTNLREYMRVLDFDTLYSNYDGSTWWIPAGLQTVDPDQVTMGSRQEDGFWPRVQVDFFVDETTLPAEFGPVGDLDGDGALLTTDCSTTYKLLPARFTLYYDDVNDPDNERHYLIFASDS